MAMRRGRGGRGEPAPTEVRNMEWMRINFRKAEESSAMKTEKATVMGRSACKFFANSKAVTNLPFGSLT